MESGIALGFSETTPGAIGGQPSGFVLLTGATGTLGRPMLKGLLLAGYRVKALVRKLPADAQEMEAEYGTLQWVEGPLHDVILLRQEMAGAIAVVHVAGMVKFSAKGAKELLHVNQEGTAAIVNAMLEVCPRAHLLHISSVAALTNQPENAASNTEVAQYGGWYGFSKRLAELEVERGAAEGLAFTGFRPSVILTRHPQGRSSASLVEMATRRLALTPPGFVHFVAARDVVEAVLASLTAGPDNTFYTLDSGPARWQKLFSQIRKQFNAPGKQVTLPDGVFKNLAYLTPLAGIFYSGPTPTRRQILNLMKLKHYQGVEKTEALLGRKLLSLEEAVAEM